MAYTRIKERRIELDMTQAELARRCSVSRQTINAVENDDYNPSINLCIAICKALDRTLDQLFWFAT